ncbi:MAG TPA: hypothetical protein VFY53_00085 [Rhodoplanes sp.]|nr:hypothetical protein [Rhodoplanes sp.]
MTERVLIVDDGPVQRRRLAIMVAESGYAPIADARLERTEPLGGDTAPPTLMEPTAREALLPLFADDGELLPPAEIEADAIRFAPVVPAHDGRQIYAAAQARYRPLDPPPETGDVRTGAFGPS